MLNTLGIISEIYVLGAPALVIAASIRRYAVPAASVNGMGLVPSLHGGYLSVVKPRSGQLVDSQTSGRVTSWLSNGGKVQ
jgi:hypothetical protein